MQTRPPKRYLAVDGLRGVAALCVLVFHMFWNSAGSDELRVWLPDIVDWSTGLLRSGVAVFFVISGFVIAHTTRSLKTFDEGWRFSARRQVRLDPPYYAAMAFVVVVESVQRLVPGLVGAQFSPVDILANMVYLQDILSMPSVLAVAWTLCLEVQFYVVVVLVAMVASVATRSESARRVVIVGIMSLVTTVSLVLPIAGVSAGPWVLGLWWMFGLGMAISWFADGITGWWVPAATITAAVASSIATRLIGSGDPWGGDVFAILTAALILAWAARGTLARSPGGLLLGAGRISYSLYLIHLPVIALVSGIGAKLVPGSGPIRLVFAVAGGACAVGAALLLHHYVEKRSIDWARRIAKSRMTTA